VIALDVQLAALEGIAPSEPTAQDERGTELLYRLLDAELAHERAVRELAEARAALAAYTASVKAARTPEPVATVATAPAHHPSFTPSVRRSFFAKLGKLCDRHGYTKEYAYDLAETVQRRIRPSAMTSLERADYLLWLETPEAVAAYETFAAARLAELSARIDAEGPTVKCENCAAPASSPIRCRKCGWTHKAAA